ncbi:hypothetical protein J4862_02180 [Porphyromonas sp. oral taxon 275]|nr:hypothetical protein [Porphyromonas sp. oral taxon 275]QUB43937.1 hypothetical protein J4862_02180 [Porphyromonas sp. oral taxon 275]
MFDPYQATYHRPASSNFIGKIALCWEHLVAPFVDTPMPLLLLKVSLVWLSRGESIGRVLEEMALISLESEDKICLLLDHLFGYFHPRTHGIHRNDGLSFFS